MSALLPALRDPGVEPEPLTRAQYELLAEAGAFEDRPVELLEGVLSRMAPQGDDHAWAVGRLTTAIARRLPDGLEVAPQMPLAASDLSEPEPDLAVVPRRERRSGLHRTAALVVEVAVTSLRRDLGIKARIYAEAGVERYWVLDLTADEAVVHTGPGPSGYARAERVALDAPLELFGDTVRLSELLS